MEIRKWIHFSVEGVIQVFKEIHDTKPTSIFEHPFFSSLKEIKEATGVGATLYCYEKMQDFTLEQLQQCYWDELKNSCWLDFGWYGECPEERVETVKLQENSFVKVCKLITNNTRRKMNTTASFRCYKKDFSLDILKGAGINTVLFSKNNTVNSEWPERIYEHVQMNGLYWENPLIAYKRMDIRIKEASVEKVMGKIKVLANEKLTDRIECCVWEDDIESLEQTVETVFLQSKEIISNMAMYKAMIPQASCLDKDILYFSVANDNSIYSLDLLTYQTKLLVSFPFEPMHSCFSAMYFYDGVLYGIPFCLHEIWSFNIESNKINKYILPIELKKDDFSIGRATPSIQYGEKIYMVLNLIKEKAMPVLVCFNTETEKYEKIANWPNALRAVKSERVDFLQMSIAGDKLYISSVNNKGICFDLVTNEMEIWEAGSFSQTIMLEDKELKVPFVSDNGVFKICSKCGEEIYEVEKVKEEELVNVFFPSSQYKKRKYFCSYGPRAVCFDMEANSFSELSFETKNFMQLSYLPMKYYCASMIYEWEAGFVVVPFRNNMILVLNKDGKISSTIPLMEDKTAYYSRTMRYRPFVQESHEYDLKDYILSEKKKKIGTVSNNIVGTEIIKILKE